MTSLLRPLVTVINRFVPKGNHAVIYGWPDYADNLLAVEAGLRKSEVSRVILLMGNPDAPVPYELGEKTIRVRKNSLIGLFWFLTARYVFFTHPCFVRCFPKNVISINLWHGMPIKRIGRMLKDHDGIRSQHVLATSPFWARIMEESMTPWHSALDTGLPRNDRLFMKPDQPRETLGMREHQKLIVWLPTYRQSVRGEIRQDGHEYHNVFAMPDIDVEALNAFLAAHNAMLLVKPHPMAVFDQTQEWSHLKIVGHGWLRNNRLSLYQTLAAADVLVSDISSVVIDFLLLDRPIIHAFPDMEAYRDSRGFSVEPIVDFLAGSWVSNQVELLASLESELAGHDPHAEKRRNLRNLSHRYQDDKATERLMKKILNSGF